MFERDGLLVARSAPFISRRRPTRSYDAAVRVPHPRRRDVHRRGRVSARATRGRDHRRDRRIARVTERGGRARRQALRQRRWKTASGGLLLMSTMIEPAIRSAALHHGGQRRRRQEHADRPAAVRHQVDLRGSARGASSGASRRRGDDGLNLALLTDGLRAEREQKITIDVAYRYFATPRRNFIIADTPGHVQYTRNMVTGASTADLAIDPGRCAPRACSQQSRRHAFIASLLGIPHVVVAVNKMDLVGYSRGASTRRWSRSSWRWPPELAIHGHQLSSRCRRSQATTSSTRRRACPGMAASRCSHHLETVNVGARHATRSISAFPCST